MLSVRRILFSIHAVLTNFSERSCTVRDATRLWLPYKATVTRRDGVSVAGYAWERGYSRSRGVDLNTDVGQWLLLLNVNTHLPPP